MGAQRITHFLNYAQALVGDTPRLEPVRKAAATLKIHARRVVQRWTSTYTNARLEGFNGLFQADRAEFVDTAIPTPSSP